MNNYYVYLFIDPRDNHVFYVGKGKGDRIDNHFKEYEKYLSLLEQKIPLGKARPRLSNVSKLALMRRIREAGFEIITEKVIENISEESAFVLEEILVERFGRKVIENGLLTNLEPGGKWKYPKVTLDESEKTSMDEVRSKFPELLKVLDRFPHIASKPAF